MIHKIKELLRKRYVRIICVAVCAVLLAFVIELCFQIKLLTLDDSMKGNIGIDIGDCSISGNISEEKGTLFIKAGECGEAVFDVNGYVDRLVLSYDTDGTFEADLKINYVNMYKANETVTISDINPVYIKDSVINIRKNVNSITLIIKENPCDVSINGITVRNVSIFNPIRFIFFFLGLSAIGMLIVLRDVIAVRTEVGFAAAAGLIGLSMVIAMPLVRVGFDEEAHFRNSFVLSAEGTTVENDTLWDMLNTEIENHPGFRTASYEEYVYFKNYLNENALYIDNGKEEFRLTERTTSGMATFAYIFMALGMSIARLFKMGFGNIYILGRLINLATYIIVMFFAIKNLKKGKLLLAVLGLMPTAMFLSSTISYDSVVISFIALGLSYIINGLTCDEGMTWKNYISGCGFLGFGCLAKAVYAPLFLILLLYPAVRFNSKKTKLIMKSGAVFCTLVLLATAVLPLLLGHDGGDNRGGDTSHIGQLGYIMSNPFGYLSLMVKSIGINIQSFTAGAITLDNMYFFGYGHFIVFLDLLLATVIVTQGEDGILYRKKDRIWISVILFSVVALIWTSLYMAFTEPGIAAVINGVQGRYFIPLLFLGFSMFTTTKIKCKFNKKIFYPLVIGIMSCILCFETYTQIILNSCG